MGERSSDPYLRFQPRTPKPSTQAEILLWLSVQSSEVVLDYITLLSCIRGGGEAGGNSVYAALGSTNPWWVGLFNDLAAVKSTFPGVPRSKLINPWLHQVGLGRDHFFGLLLVPYIG